MPFEFVRQNIWDVILVKPVVYRDKRGFFAEKYKKSDFVNNGIEDEFVQDNHSMSDFGVIRGLHYQIKPYTQSKLLQCIKGKIYDVAVDIRHNSPTFMQYVKVELSDENGYMLYVPKGFAHGFVVLSERAEILYKVSSEYMPGSERSIKWNDSDLNIDWGISFDPILSEKDNNAQTFRDINLQEVV